MVIAFKDGYMITVQISCRIISFPIMDNVKRTKLEAAGFRIGETQDFLKLTDEEMAYIYENVPYYRRIFDEAKIRPTDIRTKSDLTKLPILDKETVRREL